MPKGHTDPVVRPIQMSLIHPGQQPACIGLSDGGLSAKGSVELSTLPLLSSASVNACGCHNSTTHAVWSGKANTDRLGQVLRLVKEETLAP